MTAKTLTPRQRSRLRSTFPLGALAALIVAFAVILAGIIKGIDPVAILIRAGVSAVVVGFLSSFGVACVRLLNGEQRKVRESNRKSK